VLTLTRFGALLLLAAFPRVRCDVPHGDVDPTLAAPSASVVTIAAGIGFCDDLDVCAKECNGGSSDRCRRLGVNYEFGHGVDVDGAHATALYEKSCTMGNSEGCLSTGRMYEFHHGVTKDDAKAVSFYRRACDIGDQAGCANLAIMLEAGRGTPKDLAEAAKLFADACTHGSSLACTHAKALRGPRDGGAHDGG
jgi:TPR repeat protein